MTYHPHLTARVRTALGDRRRARDAHRRLAADLACYTSDAEVGDLLAALEEHDSAEAEQMRTILTGNLARRTRSAA